MVKESGAAHDGDGDLAPLGAAELLDDVVDVLPLGGGAVDGGDDVPGADPEAVGRRPLDGGDDGDLVVPDPHDDPQAGEAAHLALLHGAVGLGVEEIGVGVQHVHHPLDGGVDQPVALRLAGIPRLHLLQQFGELAEGVVLLGLGVGPPEDEPQPERQGGRGQDGDRYSEHRCIITN
jgi:hypothetical protein